MTKGDFIELVIRRLTGGNPTADSMGKYDPRVVAAEIATTYDSILIELYNAVKRKNDFRVFDTLTKEFLGIAVNYNQVRNQYYSILPEHLSAIPNYIALRRVMLPKVSSVGSDYETIKSVPINSHEVFAGLPVSNVMTDKTYSHEGDKIFYYDWNLSSVTNPTVRMNIVVPFNKFDDTDPVYAPLSMEGSLFDMVIKRMLPTFPIKEDINDDNTIE